MVPSQSSAMCLEQRVASCVTDGAIRLSLRAWHHPKQDVCALKGLSTAELHHESRDWAKTGWERAGAGARGRERARAASWRKTGWGGDLRESFAKYEWEGRESAKRNLHCPQTQFRPRPITVPVNCTQCGAAAHAAAAHFCSDKPAARLGKPRCWRESHSGCCFGVVRI